MAARARRRASAPRCWKRDAGRGGAWSTQRPTDHHQKNKNNVIEFACAGRACAGLLRGDDARLARPRRGEGAQRERGHAQLMGGMLRRKRVRVRERWLTRRRPCRRRVCIRALTASATAAPPAVRLRLQWVSQVRAVKTRSVGAKASACARGQALQVATCGMQLARVVDPKG
jgi:hypothetical protein